MKTLQITEANARRLYKDSTPEFRTTLEDTFGKGYFARKVTDCETYEEVCSFIGEVPVDETELIRIGFTQDEICYRKLKTIIKALNEGMSERVSEAEKPIRKFKVGDKVTLKSGSKKSNGLVYLTDFDRFIGKPLTIRGYTDTGYVYFSDSLHCFEEDWLEPYEGLKKGDLAIFWQFDKTQAVVRLFDNEQGGLFQIPTYVDNTGHWWANAIKFESKEQFKKLIEGGEI